MKILNILVAIALFLAADLLAAALKRAGALPVGQHARAGASQGNKQ